MDSGGFSQFQYVQNIPQYNILYIQCCGTKCTFMKNISIRYCEKDSAPTQDDKDVQIVEEDEEDQVDQTSNDGDQDDDVDVEDDSIDRDDICRPEILYEEEGGHVDDEVKRVQTDHIVADRWTGVSNGTGDAEDVDIRHVD